LKFYGIVVCEYFLFKNVTFRSFLDKNVTFRSFLDQKRSEPIKLWPKIHIWFKIQISTKFRQEFKSHQKLQHKNSNSTKIPIKSNLQHQSRPQIPAQLAKMQLFLTHPEQNPVLAGDVRKCQEGNFIPGSVFFTCNYSISFIFSDSMSFIQTTQGFSVVYGNDTFSVSWGFWSVSWNFLDV
jgi:hypothetical protein